MKALLSKLNTHVVLSLVTFVVGLAVTNGLITNDDGKVVTGGASALVALGLLIFGAVHHRTVTNAALSREALAAAVPPQPAQPVTAAG